MVDVEKKILTVENSINWDGNVVWYQSLEGTKTRKTIEDTFINSIVMFQRSEQFGTKKRQTPTKMSLEELNLSSNFLIRPDQERLDTRRGFFAHVRKSAQQAKKSAGWE